MFTTSTSFRLMTQNLERNLDALRQRPDVARETEYYLNNIGNAKSIDDFLGDDRLFSYAMRAHGLSDMTYAKAFMRKVLSEGTDDRASFANTLADRRYADFAKTFNFDRYGSVATTFSRAQNGTVDKFMRQSLEENAGQSDQGVRLALYFQRRAGDISSPLDLLSDQALLQVTQTALGLGPNLSLLPLDKQVEAISAKLDIEDLSDPDKLDRLLERFTTLWQVQNGPPASAAAPSIMAFQPITLGISQDLLMSLQGLKLGG